MPSRPGEAAHSLLAIIFGQCRCRAAFECTLPVDRLGGVILWFSLMAYMFKAVGTVVDQYFAYSLEKMADKWEVSQELANPTLVALGASAPELLASMFAAFVFSYAIGLGAIIGSAVFNLLVVTGVAMVVACKDVAPGTQRKLDLTPVFKRSRRGDRLCAAFQLGRCNECDQNGMCLQGGRSVHQCNKCLSSGHAAKDCTKVRVKMWAYPMVRDAFFYAIALLEVLLIVNDGEVKWYESMLMLLTYAIYCSYMVMDSQIVSILEQLGLMSLKKLLARLTHSEKQELGPIALGDLLEVRNSASQAWVLGKVAQVEPLKVVVDGYPEQANDWEMKRRPVLAPEKPEQAPQAPEADEDQLAPLENPAKAEAEEMCAFLNRFAVRPWGVLGTKHPKAPGEVERECACKKEGCLICQEARGEGTVQVRDVDSRRFIETPSEEKEPDQDTVVVDAANLDVIQAHGPSAASGQSAVLYEWLGLTKNPCFPNRVQARVVKELSAKLYTQYGGSGEHDGHIKGGRKAAVIHVVGPDLRKPPYDGLSLHAREQAQKALTTAFKNVLTEFARSEKNKLRLVPLSTGVMSGQYDMDLPHMTAEALGRGFLQLSRELRDKVLQAASLMFCVNPEEDKPDEYVHGISVAILECEDVLLPEPREEDTSPLFEELEKPVQLLRDPLTYFLELVMPSGKSDVMLFIVSSIFLCFCAFLLVDGAQRAGCVLTIAPLVAGKVFLGAGAAVGDAMHGKAAAEDGEGHGIVSYVLGPKIFDLLIGLGLPWTICGLLGWKVELHDVVPDLLVLVFVFCFLMLGLSFHGWYLTKRMGIVLLLGYAVYVVGSLLVHVFEKAM